MGCFFHTVFLQAKTDLITDLVSIGKQHRIMSPARRTYSRPSFSRPQSTHDLLSLIKEEEEEKESIGIIDSGCRGGDSGGGSSGSGSGEQGVSDGANCIEDSIPLGALARPLTRNGTQSNLKSFAEEPAALGAAAWTSPLPRGSSQIDPRSSVRPLLYNCTF
jgi:hypothetical protein